MPVRINPIELVSWLNNCVEPQRICNMFVPAHDLFTTNLKSYLNCSLLLVGEDGFEPS